MPRGIRTHPKPYCPECGAQMVLRKPRQGQTWKAFWSCSLWTVDRCPGKRQIQEDGTPEED
jgi:ssDNA-binding Zn-finger/Zn-ribbon topoisomerase 1